MDRKKWKGRKHCGDKILVEDLADSLHLQQLPLIQIFEHLHHHGDAVTKLANAAAPGTTSAAQTILNLISLEAECGKAKLDHCEREI